MLLRHLPSYRPAQALLTDFPGGTFIDSFGYAARYVTKVPYIQLNKVLVWVPSLVRYALRSFCFCLPCRSLSPFLASASLSRLDCRLLFCFFLIPSIFAGAYG